MRRFAIGEEPVTDHRVPARQPPSGGRPFANHNLAQPIGDAPVRRQPGDRIGMARSQLQDRARHRKQRVQIERIDKTVPDQFGSPRLAHLHALAKSPRQDPAPHHREMSATRRLRDRADKNVFLDGGEIELPRRNAGSPRRRGKLFQILRRPADRQVIAAAGVTALVIDAGRRPRRFAFGCGASGSAGVTAGAGRGATGSVSQGYWKESVTSRVVRLGFR
jgi:hypothetical protein